MKQLTKKFCLAIPLVTVLSVSPREPSLVGPQFGKPGPQGPIGPQRYTPPAVDSLQTVNDFRDVVTQTLTAFKGVSQEEKGYIAALFERIKDYAEDRSSIDFVKLYNDYAPKFNEKSAKLISPVSIELAPTTIGAIANAFDAMLKNFDNGNSAQKEYIKSLFKRIQTMIEKEQHIEYIALYNDYAPKFNKKSQGLIELKKIKQIPSTADEFSKAFDRLLENLHESENLQNDYIKELFRALDAKAHANQGIDFMDVYNTYAPQFNEEIVDLIQPRLITISPNSLAEYKAVLETLLKNYTIEKRVEIQDLFRQMNDIVLHEGDIYFMRLYNEYAPKFNEKSRRMINPEKLSLPAKSSSRTSEQAARESKEIMRILPFEAND